MRRPLDTATSARCGYARSPPRTGPVTISRTRFTVLVPRGWCGCPRSPWRVSRFASDRMADEFAFGQVPVRSRPRVELPTFCTVSPAVQREEGHDENPCLRRVTDHRCDGCDCRSCGCHARMCPQLRSRCRHDV